MIFYFNSSGTLLKTTPEPVYQGSNNANTIYFVAPIIPTAQVSAVFTLPNSEVSSPILLTSSGAIPNTATSDTTVNFAMWYMTIPNSLTAYAGNLTAQFTINVSNQTINTQAVVIPVLQGVAPVLPLQPTTNIYNQILQELSVIQADITDINNKIPATYITNVLFNSADNTITIYYSDGSTSTITLPNGSGATVIYDDWLRTITFTTESFVEGTSGEYMLAFSPTQTQFSDNNYIVQLTQDGEETYEAGSDTSPIERQGEYTLADSVFKGTDGTLLLTATTPYAGRILLMGGSTAVVNPDEDVLKSPTQTGAFVNSNNTLNNAVTPFKVESKNLIPFPYYDGGAGETFTSNGVTFTVNSDGSVTANGTATGNALFYLLNKAPAALSLSGIMTQNLNASEDIGTNVRLRVSSGIYGIGQTYDSCNTPATGFFSQIQFIVISINIGTTVNNVTFYPQLEYGDTATSYTPYLPAETSVNITACGKNLFNAQGEVKRFSAGPSAETHLFYDVGKVTASYLGSGSTTYVMFAQKYPAGVYSFSAVYETVSEVASDKHVSIMISIPAEGFTFNSYYNAYSMANYNDLPSILINASEPFTLGLVFRNTNDIEQENAASYSDIMLVRGDISDYGPYSGTEYSTQVGQTVKITQRDKYTTVYAETDGVAVSGQFILSTQYELDDKLTPLFGTFANRPTTTQPYTIMYIATDQTGDNKVTILPPNTDGSVSTNWISI